MKFNIDCCRYSKFSVKKSVYRNQRALSENLCNACLHAVSISGWFFLCIIIFPSLLFLTLHANNTLYTQIHVHLYAFSMKNVDFELAQQLKYKKCRVIMVHISSELLLKPQVLFYFYNGLLTLFFIWFLNLWVVCVMKSRKNKVNKPL